MIAVKRYPFNPAIDRNGQPVPFKAHIEVNFRVP
jgi:hypothetical protein